MNIRKLGHQNKILRAAQVFCEIDESKSSQYGGNESQRIRDLGKPKLNLKNKNKLCTSFLCKKKCSNILSKKKNYQLCDQF